MCDTTGFDGPPADDVLRCLAEDLPGGKYSAPHWADGPYWLLPVDNGGQPPRVLRRMLSGCPILIHHAPVFDLSSMGTVNVWDAKVYAAPELVREVARFDPTEDVFEDRLVGPFESQPTSLDLFVALSTVILGPLDDPRRRFMRSLGLPVLEVLDNAQVCDTVAFLAAVNTLAAQARLGGLDDVVRLLRAAIEVASNGS